MHGEPVTVSSEIHVDRSAVAATTAVEGAAAAVAALSEEEAGCAAWSASAHGSWFAATTAGGIQFLSPATRPF